MHVLRLADSRSRCIALATGVALLLTGCITYTIHGTIPERQPKAATTPDFRAGTHKVDLTPIPGVPIGGIGPMAKIARGFWTRLHARALYMEDPKGDPLVLVVCDLPIIPSGLTDNVARLLSEDAALKHIGLENLLLSATETHQGPGNYMTDQLHNAIDTPRAGFDPELFHFLSTRIVDAIRGAEANAKKATLSKGAGPLAGFFRNRSFEAFLLNRGAEDDLSLSGLAECPLAEHKRSFLETRTSHAYGDPRACQAVESGVTILKLGNAADPSEAIGLAVFLAAHPVVLTVETEVFSGDLFAVAANLLETPDYCAKGTTLPTVAIFNGAQGDVSVIFEPRDRARLLELGGALADHICGLLGSTVAISSPDIFFRYEKIADLALQPVADPTDSPPHYQVQTASEARPGAAQISGAEEARTIFHDLGHHEGLRRFVRDEHGVKSMPGQIDLGGIHLSLLPRLIFGQDPPEVSNIPIGVYQVGGLVLVSLPGEFTTTMGRRIRKAIETATGDPTILVGLANGHTTYVTTPEEYDRQHYEGASSFFGPATGPLFKQRIEQLAGGLNAPNPADRSTAPDERSYYYRTGKKHVFKPRGVGWPPYYVDDGLANIVQDTSSRSPERQFPTFCWEDGVPRLGGHVYGDQQCTRHLPDVSIVSVASNAVIADNKGKTLDLVTVVAGVERSRMEWCAIWMVPEPECSVAECAALEEHPACVSAPECLGGQFRFKVEKVDGVTETSSAFAATDDFLHRALSPPRPLTPEPPWVKFWCLPFIDGLGLCSGTCEVQHP